MGPASLESLPGALEGSLQRFPQYFALKVGHVGKRCRTKFRLQSTQAGIRKNLSGLQATSRRGPQKTRRRQRPPRVRESPDLRARNQDQRGRKSQQAQRDQEI